MGFEIGWELFLELSQTGFAGDSKTDQRDNRRRSNRDPERCLRCGFGATAVSPVEIASVMMRIPLGRELPSRGLDDRPVRILQGGWELTGAEVVLANPPLEAADLAHL